MLSNKISTLNIFNETSTKPTLDNRFLCGAIFNAEDSYNNSSITFFSSVYFVPKAPTNKANQKLFIINGLQPKNSERDYKILASCLLQWSTYANDWVIASTLVTYHSDGSISNISSPYVSVSEGAKLTSRITNIPSNNGFQRYEIGFLEYPETKIIIDIEDKLTQAGVIFETIDVNSCDCLPFEKCLTFKDISCKVENKKIKPKWNIKSPPNACGINITINENNENSITLSFKQ
ncbi:hypothetical protein ACNPN6_06455 [Enterobacter quasiroggenkampii]|uniref:hypothetical protein n=1 Tax=Enterobacter quasiroggenkampii TaxID=2497436 RepID=UPI000A9507AB|nr:hypothetical protein [Enterobacter quasiroggenkampii]